MSSSSAPAFDKAAKQRRHIKRMIEMSDWDAPLLNELSEEQIDTLHRQVFPYAMTSNALLATGVFGLACIITLLTFKLLPHMEPEPVKSFLAQTFTFADQFGHNKMVIPAERLVYFTAFGLLAGPGQFALAIHKNLKNRTMAKIEKLARENNPSRYRY